MRYWLMSKYYDNMLRDAEEKCLKDWRKALLQNLSGDILELGSGTGANLDFYPKNLNSLTLTEPNQHMRSKLIAKLDAYQDLPTIMHHWKAESIPAPDDSYDAVVSTLMLCSVKNPQQVLSEIFRVLKHGGKFIFIEHVIATNKPKRLKWQKRIEPFWKIISCGCHLTRDTEKYIKEAGFTIQKISHQSMRGVPGIVRPSIWGEAIKP